MSAVAKVEAALQRGAFDEAAIAASRLAMSRRAFKALARAAKAWPAAQCAADQLMAGKGPQPMDPGLPGPPVPPRDWEKRARAALRFEGHDALEAILGASWAPIEYRGMDPGSATPGEGFRRVPGGGIARIRAYRTPARLGDLMRELAPGIPTASCWGHDTISVVVVEGWRLPGDPAQEWRPGATCPLLAMEWARVAADHAAATDPTRGIEEVT